MTDTKNVLSNRPEWLEKIVSESDAKVDQVERVLQKYDIRAQSTFPKSQKIQMKSIFFQGEKKGTQKNGAFSFEWAELSSGLWGIISDQNLRGKSSVLNIFHATLQGEFPGRIQDDVWAWICALEVVFTIGNIDYSLKLKKNSGEISIKEVKAILSRCIKEEWLILYEGIAGDELKEAVSNLFMSELNFDNFYAFNKTYNIRKTHGWSAISSALFIGQESSALFGDHAVDGLPLRLLQLFIGLPWISTYTAINVALKQLEQIVKESKEINKNSETTLHLKNEIKKLEEEKLELEKKKSMVINRSFVRKKLIKFDGNFFELQKELNNKRANLAKLEEERYFIDDELISAKRTLQQLKDEQASGYLFRKLRPQCCPACEANITIKEDNSLHVEGTCALCGKSEELNTESFDERLKMTQEVIDEFTDLKIQLEKEKNNINIKISSLEKNSINLNEEIEESQNQLEDQSGIEFERRLISVDAQIDTLNHLMELTLSQEKVTENINEESDIKILKAAEKITKLAFEELQKEILKDISKMLTKYTQDIGIVNIKDMQLNPRGHLHIEKGGTVTTFSKLTLGEALRVRIAIALAVVDVAKKRGYGRHPSLLILDSPAAQEMSSDDFSVILANLQRMIKDKNELQIIVGAVAQDELLSVIDIEFLKYAQDKDYLF